MVIRAYEPEDLAQVLHLFYQTVHGVNCKDYTPEQLAAWAPETLDVAGWGQSLARHETLVALEGETLVGFGDLGPEGYLDRLYVHKDFQGRGIATALCDRLEALAGPIPITTHASITAKGFFERRGYVVLREQQVERRGVLLTNFEMRKN